MAPEVHQVRKKSRLDLEHNSGTPQVNVKLPDETNLNQDADKDAESKVKKSKVPLSLRSELEKMQSSKPINVSKPLTVKQMLTKMQSKVDGNTLQKCHLISTTERQENVYSDIHLNFNSIQQENNANVTNIST